MFKTQQEIWKHLSNGGTVYLSNTIAIKFIDGALHSDKAGKGKWEFCPVAFENPKLFRRVVQF